MPLEYPKRKPLRLPDFDYSQASAYFVTMCSYNRKCIFGDIADDCMHLNKLGSLIDTMWAQLPESYSFVALENWVIMPNHLHAIIWLEEKNPDNKNLSDVICSFKSTTTLQARKFFDQKYNLWQRGFYEHIIRDEKDLFRIRQYIEDNPVQWAVDSENPDFDE